MKQLLLKGGGLLKSVALACVAGFALSSFAGFDKTNPVTGETETYANTFTGGSDGTATEWNDSSNWDTAVTPFVSGDYNASLVDGKTASTSTAIDGYTLRVGAYNGAAVTWSGGITKIQAGTAGCWLTADATSSITLAFNGNSKQLEGSSTYPLKLSSAKAGGITWTSGLTNAGNTSLPFWYYLKGAGTVVYGGDITVANAQVIKQADVTLSGVSQVSSKTLVTFGSGTTATFTADAAIKVYDTNGDEVETVNTATVNTTGSTTLTTDSAVGSCELVQTSTGIVLYYVDGDPSAIVAKTYQPSISVNFCHGNAPLTVAADVGVGDYAVPGTSWNNMISAGGNSGTFSTPLTTIYKIDSTGATSLISGASVSVSGTRGSWNKGNVPAASDVRNGYIDDNDSNASPQFVVEGIPYYSYKTIIYFASDNNDTKFGYVTVNGVNYKGDLDNTATVAAEVGDIWGAASDTSFTEGGNYLVIPTQVNTDGTLTVVSHRLTGCRAGLAAVQIIEVPKTAEEGELVIDVSDDTTYTVSENATYTTVYVTGAGTLAFDGEGTITTTTLNVGPCATVPMGSSITPTTVTGAGTVVYDGVKPTTGLGWTDSANWTGTVWVKNITTSNDARKDWNPALYGNAESTLRFTDVNLYFPSTTTEFSGTVELDAGGLNICDGYGGSKATFAKLTGSGTLSTGGGSSNGNGLMIRDASEFTGTITLTKYKVIIGSSDGTSASGVLQIDSGAVATVASGKTWTAPGGFVVNGTLNADGTLASSHASQAVSGSGTVVFTGRAPTPTGDAWWKNSAWTGTVQIGNITDMIGRTSGYTGTYLDFNSYGNANSLVKLGDLTGWMDNYTCNVPVNLAGTLTINNGISGEVFTFKKLISSGGYITATDQSATFSIRIEDGSEYAGYIGLNSKRVIFGTGTAPAFVKGQIYVSSDATITVPSVNTAYWAVGGIVVDGELKADNLARFGGGTNITTGDDGVFTLTSTGNGSEGETDTDYARIKGTGSLKYEGTGWRALTTNNLSTAVTLVNEQSGDILLSRALTYTIGSLSGSKNFQGNYGSGNRYLNVIQSKDTEWSGKVVNDGSSRFAGLKLDASSTGTLTLSGTASQNVALEVNGGSVNLTGTWVGATTVSGTFGGTGTLTGDLTFADGATFKAFTTDEDGLAVSGTIAYPENVKVTVELAEVPVVDTVLITASGLEADKFELASGTDGSLKVEDDALVYVTPYAAITVPNVANATVVVTADGETIQPATAGGTVYGVALGATVTVTYTAAEGYSFDGATSTFTLENVSGPVSVDVASLEAKPYVAQIKTGQTTYENYTSLAGALASENVAYGITLLADISEAAVTVSSSSRIMGAYTISSDVTVANGGQLTLTGVTLTGTLTIQGGGLYVTGGGTIGTLVTQDGATISLTTLSDTTAPLAVSSLTVNGALTVVSTYGAAVRGTTYKAISYVTEDATIAEGATFNGQNEWSASTVVDGDNTLVCLAITKVAKIGDTYYETAQDAVDAAVASGGQVEFLVAPGTVTLGAGETLVVTGANQPTTVALDEGLTNPPYSIESDYDLETLVYTYTVVGGESGGIDPTTDGSTQTVTVDTSLSEEAQEAEAIAAASVVVPSGVSGVDAATYKTYFAFSATPTETAGEYEVAITGFADEVTETADGNALEALEAAQAGAALGSIEVKPGLFYGTAAGDDVSALKASAGALNTTGSLDLSGVTKPANGSAYFIKIKVGTSAFAAEQ